MKTEKEKLIAALKWLNKNMRCGKYKKEENEFRRS